MPQFSKSSKEKLATCHPDLQKLFNEVIKHVDCSVICGHRSRMEQNRALASGTSKLQWPNSRHNTVPSLAADVVPYPVNWKDTKGFEQFAKFVLETADRLGIFVEWGGDWKTFSDLPHYQLRNVES